MPRTGASCCIYVLRYILWALLGERERAHLVVQLGRAVCNTLQFHHEFRRERKPDFAEEESVGLLKALRRGRRD